METQTPPGPETVALALEPWRPVLWAALEYGIGVARDHFGDGPVGRWLGPHLARYHAREYLVVHGLPCEELPNDGIAFTLDHWHFRVLKADEGELPVPGASQKKQDFYGNLQLLLPGIVSQNDKPEVNFVLLWDAAPGSFLGLTLALACPKGGATTRDSVEAYWYAPVPHPGEVAPGHTPAGGPTASDDDDLDIGPLGSEGTGDDDDDED